MAPIAWQEALWFGRSQHENKTNKQTTFIDRYEGNFIAKTSPFVNMIFLMVTFML